jgi:hypothetical protein
MNYYDVGTGVFNKEYVGVGMCYKGRVKVSVIKMIEQER